MKRKICLMLVLALMAVSLTACGMTGGGKQSQQPKDSPVASTETPEAKVVHGIINKIDSYLVLLTGEGEYQIMDYGEGVTMDDFMEGDSVDVTYTGELGVEGSTPVIVSIVKAD